MAEWPGVAGRQVLITGATSGIELAGAKELARRGAKLAIVAERGQGLRDSRADTGSGRDGRPGRGADR